MSIIQAAGSGEVGSGSFYSNSIDQSLRFNDGDSAYLTRTPSSASNQKTWTWSSWIKRSTLGATQTIFSGGTGSTLSVEIRFGSSDKIEVLDTNNSYLFITSAVFRDVSSFYNIVLVNDTTQSTVNNRTKLFVNGTQITSFSTDNRSNFAEDEDTGINSANAHYIGRWINGGQLFDGYMAEINFLDGIANDPTTLGLGETKDGIWIPKAYSGSHGTNGFYLPFDDSSAIGDDESANTNDWTPSGLVASDVVLDSPNTNFATYNPLSVQGPAGEGTYSATNGNLGGTTTSGSTSWVGTTFGLPSGKWYWEARSTGSTSGWPRVGFYSMGAGGDSISSITSETSNNLSSLRLVYNSGCGVEPFGSTSVTQITGSISSGDILQIAIDVDAGKIWYGVNNTYLASGNPATGANAIDDYTATTYNPVIPCVGTYNSQALPDLNFGQDSSFAGAKTAQGNADSNGVGDFYYAPPSGFLALASSNLPDITIGPNQTTQIDENFNTVLYQSNGGTNAITGMNFKADFLWIKQRDSTNSHAWTDSLRGVTKALSSNLTNTEYTYTNGMQSFDSDGFTLNGNNGWYNSSTTRNYVAWGWLAGGTPTATNSAGAGNAPTSGSVMIDGVASTSALAGAIPATKLSANTTSGFSIVSYTGNGSADQTIAHGLSSPPELTIIKDRDSNSNNNQWQIGSSVIGDKYVYFTTTAPAGSAGVLPTSGDATTLTIARTGNVANNTNESGDNFIMYNFHSVEGYSKVGFYEGNGDADGAFVFTGFRVAFLLAKSIDSTSNWYLFDNKREGYNPDNDSLLAETTGTETTTDRVDLLSNGFKLRISTDPNVAETFVYLAIADQPFKFSNAR